MTLTTVSCFGDSVVVYETGFHKTDVFIIDHGEKVLLTSLTGTLVTHAVLPVVEGNVMMAFLTFGEYDTDDPKVKVREKGHYLVLWPISEVVSDKPLPIRMAPERMGGVFTIHHTNGLLVISELRESGLQAIYTHPVKVR
jgi:hypothetical protein